MTLADALSAHEMALSFGGRPGISSLHLIESALARPYFGYHRTLAEKATALMHSMIGNHGFVDGNKRTAWILVELLIERSGYHLDIDDDEPVDDLVVAVAAHDISADDLLAWFQRALVREPH
ncbi:type II toxin-antitoxin system death-on-curing family toxin [Allosediminivita pacifica]|nr:type II toxin-antitoxin system death-on-curing family toxin [Allosediminivita pacifica]GGB11325.1 death-on-curing protein [Allosediminivita pacifica]